MMLPSDLIAQVKKAYQTQLTTIFMILLYTYNSKEMHDIVQCLAHFDLAFENTPDLVIKLYFIYT